MFHPVVVFEVHGMGANLVKRVGGSGFNSSLWALFATSWHASPSKDDKIHNSDSSHYIIRVHWSAPSAPPLTVKSSDSACEIARRSSSSSSSFSSSSSSSSSPPTSSSSSSSQSNTDLYDSQHLCRVPIEFRRTDTSGWVKRFKPEPRLGLDKLPQPHLGVDTMSGGIK